MAHGPMRRLRERKPALVANRQLHWERPDGFATEVIGAKRCLRIVMRTTCDKASPAVVVMLHLRSCYVSKAAILTLPIQSVPVENRSPA